VAGGIGIVLMKGSLCCEAAIADLALPLFVFLLVSSTVLDVLVVPIVGSEVAIARETPRHFVLTSLSIGLG
jgi:hypothetical protein